MVSWRLNGDVLEKRIAPVSSAKALLKRMEGLGTSIGDGRCRKLDQYYIKPTKAVVLANEDIELLTLPGHGGGIFRIRDLDTGVELGKPNLGNGTDVGPCLTTQLGRRKSFEVKAVDRRTVEMVATGDDMRWTRTISVSPSGPSFRVLSTMTREKRDTSTDAFRTELNFQANGQVEDYYLVYRDGLGRMHSQPVRNPWLTHSSGWGVTGMLALVNPKTNSGFMWELSTRQNGCWLRMYPHNRQFGFWLFGERTRTGAGETARHDETITIIRDVQEWCEDCHRVVSVVDVGVDAVGGCGDGGVPRGFGRVWVSEDDCAGCDCFGWCSCEADVGECF